MLIWKITSTEIDEILYIRANNFDEAIAKARRIDPRYNTGQVVEIEKGNF